MEIMDICNRLENLMIRTDDPQDCELLARAVDALLPVWEKIRRRIGDKTAVLVNDIDPVNTLTVAQVLNQMGFRCERVYRQGRYYSVWLRPPAQFPKLELDRLLKEKAR